MGRRKSTGLAKRDMFGQSHGTAGKGDKSRVTNTRQYLANLAEVNLPGDVAGLERRGVRLVKTYGVPVRKLGVAPTATIH